MFLRCYGLRQCYYVSWIILVVPNIISVFSNLFWSAVLWEKTYTVTCLRLFEFVDDILVLIHKSLDGIVKTGVQGGGNFEYKICDLCQKHCFFNKVSIFLVEKDDSTSLVCAPSPLLGTTLY